MVTPFGEPEYNPADIRNGVLKSHWMQVQLMRIHKEVSELLDVLPEEYLDSELDLSLQEIAIRCKRNLLPEFVENPLLGIKEGTEEWTTALQAIQFLYMQL